LLAVVFLVISTSLPRQSTQFLLLFHPKVPVVCLLVVLLSRVGMERTIKTSQTSGSSQIPETLSPKSPVSPVQRHRIPRIQPMRYDGAFDDSITHVPIRPMTPQRLDKINEDHSNASVRSGVTDDAKDMTLGDSRVALVGKA
jgi:hypothetical protein